jgi:HD-GYP domain-containing protein (c-di-GMP phosphodiesterase class II)
MTSSGGFSLGPKLLSLPPLRAIRRLWGWLADNTFVGQFTTFFALVTLIVVIFTGFALSRYLAQAIKDGEIADAVDEVQQHVAAPVSGQLAGEELSAPLAGAQYEQFDTFIQEDIIPTGRSGLRIWSSNGVLLYSSDTSTPESPAEDDLATARSGRSASRIDDVDVAFGTQRIFHVFTPLSLDASADVQAVLEVEQSYLPVQDRIQRAETNINMGVAGAMGFLFTVLSIIVMRGSRTSTRQKRQLVLHTQHMKRTHDSMLKMLYVALDLRDQASRGRSLRVARLAVAVAQQMGLSQDTQTHLEQAAMLHDLSKINLSSAILEKAGPLEEDEWEEIQQHPELGYQIVRDIPFLQGVGAIILHHHERFDGGGYPRGLAGEEIPMGARIFAVAEAYDAMTSDRSYRRAGTHASALRELKRNAGTQFDPQVVEAFLATDIKDLIRDLTSAKANGEPSAEFVSTHAAGAEESHA